MPITNSSDSRILARLLDQALALEIASVRRAMNDLLLYGRGAIRVNVGGAIGIDPTTIMLDKIQEGQTDMTKKHFEAIAASIKEIKDDKARLEAALAVAKVGANLNPRFNSQTFLTACGVIS